MPWTRKLEPPVILKDGRKLLTLADARLLIQSLPEGRGAEPAWQLTGDVLMGAASGQESAVRKINLQLIRALQKDGML